MTKGAHGDQEAAPMTILLQETDSDLRKIIAMSLKQKGLRVLQAETADEASAILDDKYPDILMLDLDLPYGSCGTVIERYRKRSDGERSGAILLTTDRRPGDEWRKRYRPDAVIYKPYDIRYLLRRICSLMGTQPSEASTSPA